MANTFTVETLELHVGRSWVRYDFELPMTMLLGPVGTGKSSMLETMWYGLGLNSVLMPTVLEHVAAVRLTMRVGQRRYTAARNIRKGQSAPVLVTDLRDGNQLTLPVKSAAGETTFSDFILDKWDIPRVPLAGSGAAATVLSLEHMRTLMYVRQAKISNSHLGQDASAPDPARVQAMDVALGLWSAEAGQLQARRSELKRQIAARKTRVKTLTEFLNGDDPLAEDKLRAEQAGHVTQRDAAQLEIGRLTADLKTAQAEHTRLTAEADRIGGDLKKAREAATSAAKSFDQAQASLRDLSDRQSRLTSRTADPQQCSHCRQPLSRIPAPPPGTCIQCLQPDPSAKARQDRLSQRQTQLSLQIAGAQRSRDQAQDTLKVAAARVDGLLDTLQQHLKRLQSFTAAEVTPRLQAQSQAREQLAAAKAHIVAIDGKLKQYAQLHAADQEIMRLRHSLASIEDELNDLANGRSMKRKQAIADLTELFHDALKNIGVQWFTNAYIDDKTYAPIVTGNNFNQLAVSGGRKTIVNIAYHLTLLAYSRDANVPLPSFLVIDSPREGIGSIGSDRELSDRVYDYFQTLTRVEWERRNQGIDPRVQMIVADNDPAAHQRKDSPKIVLSYASPFIPGILHPGAGNVAAVEEQHG